VSITSSQFDVIRTLVYDQSGILLSPGKEYLVENRIEGIVRSGKIDSTEDLIARLTKLEDEAIKIIVEAMTTNETSFFRDGAPFDAIRTAILPDLIDRNRAKKEINIWCAACSRGQEPVSLAMMMREHFPKLGTWKVNILATDISEKVLDQCRSGIYSRTEVGRGLPASMMVNNFQKAGLKWQLKPHILNMIDYKQMNLIKHYPPTAQMDLILIRNVLIYFDEETKVSIQKKLTDRLRPGGYMLLGTAETVRLDCYDRISFDAANYYKLKG